MSDQAGKKICPHCQTEILLKAKRCPACHADLRSWINRHPLLTILLLLIILPIFIGVLSEDSNPNKTITSTEPQMSVEEQTKWQISPAGKLCSKHLEWTHSDCDNLTNKKIWVGMTYNMLVYEWGKPTRSNPSNYGNGIRYQYCWDDVTPSCFYDNDNDKIIDSYN